MNENIFKDYVLEKLPREDDQQLFEEFLKVYQEGGKEALVKHLKGMIADLEG